MPRRTVPKYSLHKASGQARVRIDGRDIYLGVFGSKESHAQYSQEIGKWQRQNARPVQQVTVGALSKLYLEHCKSYYRKNGVVTGEVNCIQISLRQLNRKYRSTQAKDFDSLKLEAVREVMIGECYSVKGYSVAIKRACKLAQVPHWSPNQLRHNFATMARKLFGIEAARVLLGHSSAVTSEIYAERDLDAARAVAAKIG